MHEFDGKNHRFKIDDYFELYPYLKKDWEFRGRCPITGKKDGLILLEYPFEISLPYLEKKFTPKDRGSVYRNFQKYIHSMNKRMPPRHPKSDLESDEAEKINSKCEEISSDIIKKACSILSHNQSISNNYEKCAHIEVTVDFFLDESHRLFHSGTDNILCSFSALLGFSDLKNKEPHDWLTDTECLRKFKYCQMFYCLVETHSVRIEDLTLIECVVADFELRFEKNYELLK